MMAVIAPMHMHADFNTQQSPSNLTLHQQAKRASLTDFDRFKVMLLRKKKAALLKA